MTPEQLKQQAHKEFAEGFIQRTTDGDVFVTVANEEELNILLSFIDCLVDKTVQMERERIVKAVWEADDMFDKGESWSHGIREHLISIITNKSDINK